MIVEDDDNSYIQFSTPSTLSAGILSGNNSTPVRSALIFRPDSSMQVRTGGNTTRFVVLKNGNTGIGTQTPLKLLHLSAGVSGASPVSSALAVLEDNADASINLITPNANESAIYFGNAANAQHGGIVYNADNLNEMSFRTNGNITRAVLNNVGDLGIGKNTPNARIHVSNGSSSGIYHNQADIIIEDDNHAYIQFSCPSSFAGGLLAGTNIDDIRSALLFLADSSVVIRAGGNFTRLTVDKNGNSTFTGEIRRPSTTTANLVPICYGSVDDNGAILSGTGNFSVTHTSTGVYTIDIDDESYTNSGYTSNVSPVNSNPRMTAITSSGGNLLVRTYNSAGTLVDCIFHFVVYKS
jgi:hypothetical protein